MHETMTIKKIATRVLAVCLIGLTSAVWGTALPRGPRGPEQKPATTLQGKLVMQPGGTPALRADGKEYTLSAVRTWYHHTLQDERLRNREIRVEGKRAPDGTFKVSKFYTVKDGKLYRIRYFCEVCNIVALEPGKCECCQRPTELQEIPVDAK